MANGYIDSDGLFHYFGPRLTEKQVASEPEVDGQVSEVILDIDYTSVNGSVAGSVMGITTADIANREDLTSIPSGAIIVDAYLIVNTAFAGDTVEVDLVTSAKVADAGSPAGGLISAAGAATGAVQGGAFTAALSQVSYIDVVETTGAGTGGLTAGDGKVVVRYVR